MIIEACGRDLLEGQVTGEGRTRPGQSFSEPSYGCGRLLEFLVLIDNLYPTLVLLFRGFLAHICEVTIDRHDRRRCWVTSIGGRATR